jgi:hypothetical protein
MELINEMKYPLMNLLVVYEGDKPTEIPFDEPCGS